MAEQAKYSIYTAPGDGVKTNWDFNFAGAANTQGYISRDHIFVYRTNRTTGTIVTISPEWIGPNTLRIAPAVPVTDDITIKRITPKVAPLVDYTSGSLLNEKNLDSSNRQAIYAVAELVDAAAGNGDGSLTESVAFEALDKSNTALTAAILAADRTAQFATIADLLAVPQDKIPDGAIWSVDEYAAGRGREGGGWFRYERTGTSAVDRVRTFQPTNATGRWIRTRYTLLNDRMAGCAGNGLRDDTVEFQAFFDTLCTSGRIENAEIMPGNLLLQQVIVKDPVYTVSIHNNGAYFTGISIVPRTDIITFRNAVMFAWTGTTIINGQNNPNYTAGWGTEAVTGTSQATSRLKIYGLSFRNCPIGIRNGINGNDYQCSEINYFGADFVATPCCIYNTGSNSGIQLTGCSITSEPNAAFPGVIEAAIVQRGGFIKVTGGSIGCNPSAQYCIYQFPGLSPLYGTLYGTLDILGAHTEPNTAMMAITNDTGLTVKSDGASIKIIGCTGYAGGNPARDFIFIQDPTFVGLLVITGNSWYTDAVRTAYNISSTSLRARIITDSTSWGRGMRHWLGGIYSGHVIHSQTLLVSAHGGGQSFPQGQVTRVIYQNERTTLGLEHYADWNNAPAGQFEVPPWGFSSLTAKATLVVAGCSAGDFWLTKNGQPMAFGSVSGTTAGGGICTCNLDITMFDCIGGDIIVVNFAPSAGSGTTTVELTNSITFTGETT